MIELKKLSAGYGKSAILEGIDVTLEKGKLTVLAGVNGSGKSTLIKTVAGIIPSLGGEISVDGETLSSLSPKARAKKISYLSQGRSVPDMTVGELALCGRFPHLSFPRVYSEKDKRIAAEKMEQLSISHLKECHLSALSGGMRQKAYVAMALAQESDYILLDEPTTYLDIAHQIELMDILQDLAKSGKGVIAVLHDLPLAMNYADEVAIIGDGTVKMKASPDEILRSGIIKTIFGVSIARTENSNGYLYYIEKK